MTLRKVTAQRVDTFVQQSRGGLAAVNQRTREVGGVLQQLGVVMGDKRKRDFDEAAKEVQADARTRARNIEANHRAGIEEALERPETYDGSAEDFLKGEVMQGVYAELDDMPYPEHRKKFREQMDDMVLRKFGEGASRQEYIARDRQAQLAQQSGATYGIKGQMEAYTDSLATGIRDEDAFSAGLATAIQQGPEYLTEFAGAREWTPEQNLQIKKEIKRLSEVSKAKKDAEFGYLKRLMGRDGLHNSSSALQAAYALRDRKSDQMSPAELGGLQADIELLEAKAMQFDDVAKMIDGGMSKQRLYNQYPDLGSGDIDDVQNQLYRQAQAGGLESEIAFLQKNPHSLPPTYTAEFKELQGSFGALDIHNAEDMANAEAQWKRHSQIMEALGPRTVDMLLKRDAPRAFVFDAKVRNKDFKTAVASTQRWDENKAMNGGIGLRVDKKVADEVRSEVLDNLNIPAGQKDLFEAQINSMMNEARQLGIREKDDLMLMVEKDVSNLMVDGLPNSVPFMSFLGEFYTDHEISAKDGVEFIRRQVGMGGLEIPEDADAHFDPTNPRMIFFTDAETGQRLHPQALDSQSIFAEYMQNNKIPTRKERNLDAVTGRAAQRERTNNWLIERGYR
ncbi:hypothetical protein [Amphritea sp. HPY]|uniref:hypothetical protein n=1 Tax=Amphritea sp. HPY TaxID=3421652 RepID=UPI003D7C41E7